MTDNTSQYLLKKNNQLFDFDIIALLKLFWSKIIIIIVVAALCAGGAYYWTKTFVAPQYTSTTKIYVNTSNSSTSEQSTYVNSSNIYTARTLVGTYIQILKTRTTLEQVIKEADLKDADGNPMSYSALSSKVSASALDDTEMFGVSVVDTDPERAKLIANTIAEVLPSQIARVINGSSVRVVDLAVKGVKTSPNPTKNAGMGFVIGAALVCGILTLIFLTDHNIHDENYLLDNYDLPLLAVVPDLSNGKKRKSKKYRYKKYGYSKYGGYHNKAYGYYREQIEEQIFENNDVSGKDNSNV